jgi:hypothetical protein
MKARTQIRIAGLLVLAASARATVPQESSGWVPPTEPVYAVMPNRSPDGDFIMFQIHPFVPEPSDGQRRPDATALYQKGKRVAVYVDAQRRGDVQIGDIQNYHCNSSAALIAPPIRLSRKTAGLATNASGIVSRSPSRRNATAPERALAIRLANQELRRNGVPATFLSSIKETSLVAIEVDGTKEKILVGSFYVQDKKQRHDVFLITTPAGTALEYSRSGKTTDLEDFKDHRFISLFDHLDLNRDGTDEIVLGVGGYEFEMYEIYSRQHGKWELVSMSEQAGC